MYHAYKNKVEYYWYFLIFFFPLVGCLIYLYKHFYSRRKLEDLREGLKHSINSNYKIEKLEKELRFSDTIENKQTLAREHTDAGNYDRAIELYESCLSGMYVNDENSVRGLIKNYYLVEDYAAVVEVANRIEDRKRFNKTKEKTALAWAHFHLGHFKEAEKCFDEMNIPFSNFEHRLEYATFLDQTDHSDKALIILDDMLDEIDSMDSYEKGLKKQVTRQIRSLAKKLRK